MKGCYVTKGGFFAMAGFELSGKAFGLAQVECG